MNLIKYPFVCHSVQHDPAGECSPGPPDGNYIMYASATDGNRKEFSPCSRESMGRTIDVKGSCFVQRKYEAKVLVASSSCTAW